MHRTQRRRALAFCVFALCCLLGTSCSSNASLQIEAQIIYNMGGPQPIARQPFYLLDSDLKEIVRSKAKDVKAEDKVTVESMASLVALLYVTESGEELPKKWAIETFFKSKPFWESNIVRSIETDFKGQATIENLKPGDYWIVGITETRSSVAIWNHKVTIKPGENKVMLDQNNALYSK